MIYCGTARIGVKPGYRHCSGFTFGPYRLTVVGIESGIIPVFRVFGDPVHRHTRHIEFTVSDKIPVPTPAHGQTIDVPVGIQLIAFTHVDKHHAAEPAVRGVLGFGNPRRIRSNCPGFTAVGGIGDFSLLHLPLRRANCKV